MIAAGDLAADQILAIPLDQPERLFGLPGTAKHRHIELVKQWHPDRNPDPSAARVAAHINSLYGAAESKIASGTWQTPYVSTFSCTDGFKRVIRWRKRHPFELGEMLIAKAFVAFVIERRHEDHMIRGLRAIGSIRYPTNQMRTDMEKYFPKVEKLFDTKDHHVVVVAKAEDLFLLRDLIDHLGGNVPVRHVAWIISSLLNLATFLSLSDRNHNGLTTSSVFVSAKFHSSVLLGGWWYSTLAGRGMVALPPAVHAVTPRAALTSKISTGRIDLESIRAIGRACLGDGSGSGLRARADVPAPFANWLLLPSPATALQDYENWQTVLTDSFGPRRFVELPIDHDAVYPPGAI